MSDTIKPVICPQCNTEIEMDEFGFPLGNVLMCFDRNGPYFMIHFHCYTEDLILA